VISGPLPFILDFINDAGADLPDEDAVVGLTVNFLLIFSSVHLVWVIQHMQLASLAFSLFDYYYYKYYYY